jgi:hypothetical protein
VASTFAAVLTTSSSAAAAAAAAATPSTGALPPVLGAAADAAVAAGLPGEPWLVWSFMQAAGFVLLIIGECIANHTAPLLLIETKVCCWPRQCLGLEVTGRFFGYWTHDGV